MKKSAAGVMETGSSSQVRVVNDLSKFMDNKVFRKTSFFNRILREKFKNREMWEKIQTDHNDIFHRYSQGQIDFATCIHQWSLLHTRHTDLVFPFIAYLMFHHSKLFRNNQEVKPIIGGGFATEDVPIFLKEVELEFKDDVEKYKKFEVIFNDLMGDHNVHEFNDLFRRGMLLLKGQHVNLIREFISFLPLLSPDR